MVLKPASSLLLPLLAVALLVPVAGIGATGVAPTTQHSTWAASGAPVAQVLPASPRSALTPGPAVSTPAKSSLGATSPHSLSLQGGWEGLTNRSACPVGCPEPDPDVGVGGGYVLEVTNTAYRIWTTNSTLVLNGSLRVLFGTGADLLEAPQVVYDSTTLRWFVSVADLTQGAVDYAASQSSDPTGAWNFGQFQLAGGNLPHQPLLAVDSQSVVVSTDLYQGGVFAGSQVWLANKTQLLAGGTPAVWGSIPDLYNASLVPAQPFGSSPVAYLVGYTNGGTGLALYQVTGSPPGTPALTGPTTFATAVQPAPNAPQAGTPDTISVGEARVQSAVWRGGTLWAAATTGCTPAGDTVLRACLHLWELSTTSAAVLQDFSWSTGAGSYDFFPALAIDHGGDVVVAFEESSSTMDPSVAATSQSIADPPASLESPRMLRLGSSPDDPVGQCPAGVCPFGNYSGAAVSAFTDRSFWVVGEYEGANSSNTSWHTWIGSVRVVEAYSVTFDAVGLPTGISWSVTVNGVASNSTSGTIVAAEANGSYPFSVATPIPVGSGVQYVASPSSGTVTVAGVVSTVQVNFAEQFALTTSIGPSGAGTVSPSGGWFRAGSPVSLSAVPAAGFNAPHWVGTGPGSFTGTGDPVVVTANGPVSERVYFWTVVSFAVTFTESGLPAGTAWAVTVDGATVQSTTPTISFVETNGTYTFGAETLSARGHPAGYTASPSYGNVTVNGAAVGKAVGFVAVPPGPPPAIPVWALLLAVGLLGGADVGLAVTLWRALRRRPPSTSRVVFLPQPAPEVWKE